MPPYYPVFLDISGKKCLVVGGGKVAERKTLSLLKAKAKVTVISEDLSKRLYKEHERGKIRFIKKSFDITDLEDYFLVIAATSNPEINKLIGQRSPFLVNVVDNPTLSNFIVPSVINKGKLTIAISTNGVSPGLSAQIRKDLEALYGKDLGLYLRFLKYLRKDLSNKIKDLSIRRQVLTFASSKDIMDLLRNKGYKMAKEKVISFYDSTRGNLEQR